MITNFHFENITIRKKTTLINRPLKALKKKNITLTDFRLGFLGVALGVDVGSPSSLATCTLVGLASCASSNIVGGRSSDSIDCGSSSKGSDGSRTFMLDSSGKKNISTPSFSVELWSSSSSTKEEFALKWL